MKRLGLALAIVLVAACLPSDDDSRRLIRTKGSDSMLIAALAWAETYQSVRPEVGVVVNGGGSGVGIAALIDGTVDIANASRTMSEEEIARALAAGIEPAVFTVGYDAPAVIVHRDNPADSLTVAELAGIYGESGEIESWTELGIEVPGCDGGEIVRISRLDSSGTFVYFRQTILGEEREYKHDILTAQGSKDVVGIVAKTPCAVGYVALAYALPADVKMLCIRSGDGDCVLASAQSAVDGTYPIARPLLTYVAGQPRGAVKDYLEWLLSDEGQCILRRIGYAPVRAISCPEASASRPGVFSPKRPDM